MVKVAQTNKENLIMTGSLSSKWLASALLAALASSVACSGGGSLGDICANNSCSVPITALTFVTPSRLVVRVGTSVTLNGSTNVTAATYQWQRAPDGTHFVDITGATSATYTVTAQLPDDATTFRLRISNASAQSSVADAMLYVSSLPAVAFADSEFANSEWAATITASPSVGPAYSASQAASGGNPDAWRHTVVTLPDVNASLAVYDFSVSSVYDPSAQGAIRAIDYSADCTIVNSTPSIFSATVMFSQAGRNYALRAPTYCNSPNWLRVPYAALLIGDFVQVSGPACTANEICPDFSANGTPLGFGYVLANSGATGTFDRGIDNWKVTVWRR